MEAVIFIGIQGAGKSTFYRQRFFDTHIRLNLDMLRTRNREDLLLGACLAAQQPFVVDNTNVLAAERAKYIAAAKAARFRVIGYFFDTPLRDALGRNKVRPGKQAIPVPGVIGKFKRLQRPTPAEGFDELYAVETKPGNEFEVRPLAMPDDAPVR